MILFAIIPLLVVSFVIAMTVHRHSVLLAEQLRQIIKTAYLASKDEELKNYEKDSLCYIWRIKQYLASDQGSEFEAMVGYHDFLPQSGFVLTAPNVGDGI